MVVVKVGRGDKRQELTRGNNGYPERLLGFWTDWGGFRIKKGNG